MNAAGEFSEVRAGLPPAAEGPAGRREHVWLFPKRKNEALSENFELREFACRCGSARCHFTLVHSKLVETLQTLRQMLARPLILTSGFRCPGYNRVVGGRARSFHTTGMAADILCLEAGHLEELAENAQRIPAIGGIGRYPLRKFVHLDVRVRTDSEAPQIWSA